MYYLVVSGLECVQFGCLVSFGSVNLEHGKTWMLVWFHKHSKHRITTLGRLDIQIPNSMWILTSWWLTNGKIVWLIWKGRNICFMPVDWVLTGLQKKVCEPLQQQSTLSRWLAEEAWENSFIATRSYSNSFIAIEKYIFPSLSLI